MDERLGIATRTVFDRVLDDAFTFPDVGHGPTVLVIAAASTGPAPSSGEAHREDLVRLVSRHLRGMDVATMIDGHTIAVCMPEAGIEMATATAANLRRARSASPALCVGTAVRREDETPHSLFDRARSDLDRYMEGREDGGAGEARQRGGGHITPSNSGPEMRKSGDAAGSPILELTFFVDVDTLLRIDD